MSVERSSKEPSPAIHHEAQLPAIQTRTEALPRPQSPGPSRPNGGSGEQQNPVEEVNDASTVPTAAENGSRDAQTSAQSTAPPAAVGAAQNDQQARHGAPPQVPYPPQPYPNPPPNYHHPPPYAQPPPPPPGYNAFRPPPSGHLGYAYPPTSPYAQHPPPQGHPQTYNLPPQGPQYIQPKSLQPIASAHAGNGHPSNAVAYASQPGPPGPPPPNWTSPYPYANVSQYYQVRAHQPPPPPKPAQRPPHSTFPPAPHSPPPLPTSMQPPGHPNLPPPADEVVKLPDGTTRVRRGRTKARRLTRDQRRDILLMRRLGYQYEAIAKFLGTTISAVSYTVTKGTAETGHHNAGRRTHIPPEKHEQMIRYVQQYLGTERAAGIDKKTGKKKMPPLTYKMIRDAVFRDENGEIPPDLKFTDDALKQMLNKHGLWLRTPFNQMQKEQSRIRGRKQWEAKLAKDKQAAREARSVSPNSNTQRNVDSAAGSPIEAGDDEHETSVVQGYAEQGPDDEEMGEVYSGTSSEDEEEGEEEEEEEQQPMVVEQRLRQAMNKHPTPHS